MHEVEIVLKFFINAKAPLRLLFENFSLVLCKGIEDEVGKALETRIWNENVLQVVQALTMAE